jgi:hypothetical protein
MKLSKSEKLELMQILANMHICSKQELIRIIIQLTLKLINAREG